MSLTPRDWALLRVRGWLWCWVAVGYGDEFVRRGADWDEDGKVRGGEDGDEDGDVHGGADWDWDGDVRGGGDGGANKACHNFAHSFFFSTTSFVIFGGHLLSQSPLSIRLCEHWFPRQYRASKTTIIIATTPMLPETTPTITTKNNNYLECIGGIFCG